MTINVWEPQKTNLKGKNYPCRLSIFLFSKRFFRYLYYGTGAGMDKKIYTNFMSERLKNNNFSQKELAEKLDLSEDMITWMKTRPESVPIERAAKYADLLNYDIVGEAIKAADGNTPAYDSRLNRSCITLTKKRELIRELAAGNERIIKEVNKHLQKPTLVITGPYSCGKKMMTQDICGDTIMHGRFVSSTFSFDACCIEAVEDSPIKYNYDAGEYIYKIRSAKDFDTVISKNLLTEKELNDLGVPPAKGEMDAREYLVYAPFAVLNEIRLLTTNIGSYCSDESGTPKHGLISYPSISAQADIYVIMLDKVNSTFLMSVTPLLQSCYARWRTDMFKYVYFVIPKSDQFSCDEIDDIRKTYKNTYSAIYKRYKDRERYGEIDANYNGDLFKQISITLSDISEERSKRIPQILRNLKAHMQEKQFSDSEASMLRNEVNDIFKRAERCFIHEFYDCYDEILDESHILSRINRIKDTSGASNRKQNNQLIVNDLCSELTAKSCEIANTYLLQIMDNLKSKTILSSADLDSFISSSIPGITASTLAETIEKEYHFVSSAQSMVGMLAASTSALAVMPIHLAVLPAAALFAGFYSQKKGDNEKKRAAAQKIISIFSENNIKEKICKETENVYFRSIEEDIINFIGQAQFNNNNSDNINEISTLDALIKRFEIK